MTTSAMTATMTTPPGRPWLFSPGLDVFAFGGSAVVIILLLGIAALTGELPLSRALTDVPTPEWTWVTTVLLIDVAHVWGTAVLIYLDPVERRRRPLLHGLVPLGVLLLGTAVASESELMFWRILAYVAVWHFARQQVGFLRLYRGRVGEHDGLGRIIDEGTVYAVTLGPIVWWHAHLPTTLHRPPADGHMNNSPPEGVRIHWFAEGDFLPGVPGVVGDAALVVAGALLLAYTARALSSASQRRQWGKHLLVITTALVWFGGIVWWGNDLVFTVTNVVAHGLPYVVLVCWTARRRRLQGLSVSAVAKAGAVAIVGTLWAFAIVEELFWDRLVHHERAWLDWLPAIDVGGWRPVVVALLSVPQVTHYVLDGVYWKRRHHPALSSTTAPSTT
jgi:hypothetical protein